MKETKRYGRARLLVMMSAALVLMAAGSVSFLPATASAAGASACKPKCPSTTNTSSVVMPKMVAAVFNPFTASQLNQLAAHVKNKLSLLDEVPEDTLVGDYLYAVDFLADSKATVLKSIDGGKAYPGRYAKAIVYHLHNDADAKVVEYKVGPIKSFPLAASTPVVAMTPPGNYAFADSLPATMRPTLGVEFTLLEDVVATAMAKLTNLTTESYGTTYDEGKMFWTDATPRGYTNATRQSWVWFMWSREGMYALPMGLTMLIDHKSLDSSNWSVLQCAYNGQGPFNSIEALATAFNSGSLSILKYPSPNSSPSAPLWSSLRRRGSIRPLENLKPPTTMNGANGPRYVVRGRQVAWMNWDMHVGFELIAGIRFNDIRFRGERIVYELSLQDAYASYSGASPIQALSQYNDAGWGLGWTGRQLMVGVDCPAHATLLGVDFFVQGSQGSSRNSICIWEQPDDIAIMRHYDQDFWDGGAGYSYAGGILRTALVIRTTSTVYNYDYYYNYIFYAEGTIKVEALASGYLQSDSNPSTVTLRNAEKLFQTPVRKFTSGNLHDHLFSYKVDLDILGRLNSLVRSEVKVGTFNVPWNFDGQLSKMRYVDKTMVSTEGPMSWMNVNPSQPVTLAFVNGSLATNKWGQPRAYSFQLGSTITQQLDDSMPWMPSQQWTKYNIAVTQRKDSEPKSGYPLYDMQAPADAVVNFDSYINGESLANEDLVAWVMIGNIHIPSSEDIPSTTTAHTSLSFLIKPFNYFDESPAIDLTTRVHKTGNTYPNTPSTNIDKVNTPVNSRCFDGTPPTVFV